MYTFIPKGYGQQTLCYKTSESAVGGNTVDVQASQHITSLSFLKISA